MVLNKKKDNETQNACNVSEIEHVTSQKLLGVTLNSQLNFTEHIDDLRKKVAQRIAVLKSLSVICPSHGASCF